MGVDDLREESKPRFSTASLLASLELSLKLLKSL